MTTRTHRPTRAIVVGGSMAGLMAARVLSDHVDVVDVYERDAPTERPQARAHVPQGRHPHVLLSSGQELVEQWFPGVLEELRDLGARPVEGAHGWWKQGAAYRIRSDWGVNALSVTRPLLEHVVRHRVAAVANVTLRQGVVKRLIVHGESGRDRPADGHGRRSRRVSRRAAGRVTGVVVDGVHEPADLVVDCSGRHSRIVHRLAQDGLVAPPVSKIDVGLSYATRMLRRTPEDMDGEFLLVSPDLTVTGRSAVFLPVEGDRWIAALCGMHDDAAPCDDAGYRSFAASLDTPAAAELLDRCEPLSPVLMYRFPCSLWRHFEKAPQLLAGLVVLGDAVASFTPIYGQGISSAAQQAEALGFAVRRHGVGSARLPRAAQKALARVVATPWTIAAGADFTHPKTTGSKPPGTDLVNRYFARVMLAVHTSEAVHRRLMAVQFLTAAPSTLFRPSVVWNSLRAARRSPVITGRPVTEPRVAPPEPHQATA